jgi:2-polyprenyl-3-methyl-5-hydroxy-6-metoxy-1,4-benzoquinol methylase
MTNVFRFQEEISYLNRPRKDDIDTYWDDDYDLDDTVGWEDRICYESRVLQYVINTYDIKKVIELGSGTGNLGDKVLTNNPTITYHMVDGSSAKRAHIRRDYKGEIIVKDLLDHFNTDSLHTDYDLVVANDFLEHIRNPSLILDTVKTSLTTKNSYFFASSPNWRMKHHFYYPGLFDFDNFLKFFWQEGYEIISEYPSWSTNVHIKSPKLDSEKMLLDQHQFDWNYYLLFKKRII